MKILFPDPDASTIYLEKPNMKLDLGGIAKGYTADAIAGFSRI